MISATSNWNTANALLKKKPIYLIEIEGYTKAFSTANLGNASGIAVNPILQHAEIIADFGGLSMLPSSVTLGNATPAGNIIFAFLRSSGGGTINVTDTAGNTYTQLYQVAGFGAPYFTAWAAVSVGSTPGNIVTWDDGGTHHDAEFYVIEVSSDYAGYTHGGNGAATLATPSEALVTVGLNNIRIPVSAVSIGTDYSVFVAELAPAAGGNAPVRLGFIQGLTPLSTNFLRAGNQLWVFGYYDAAVYPWIVNIDPLAITVSDLDGGADLADLVFNVQDVAQVITADCSTFTFEGKKVYLKEGSVGLALVDYLTRFTGKVNSVASDNGNMEYKFTCPDIRKDLSKIIYETGDDGFATSSDHPKTLLGNPLDILIAALENEVGYAAADIDVAGIQQWRDEIFSGLEFEFRLTSPPAAKDFIENEILKPLGGYHWPNNLGVIKVHFFYPIAPASVATLDHSVIGDVPLAGQADLVNQVTTRFDDDGTGKFLAESVQSYGASITKYGLFGEHIIESTGMRAAFQGFFMAAIISRLIFLRYGSKQLQMEGVSCLWTESLLEPGDIVSLTSSIVPDRAAGVMGLTTKTFEILDRTWDFMAGKVTFKLLELDLSKFRQYLITPNGEADFAADTAPNQAQYLYLCDDNDVYSNGSPANTLC